MKFRRIVSAVTASIILAACSAMNVSASNNDPNGDGVLDLYDAIYISRYLSGMVYPTNVSQLDYSGNGVISQLDVYMVSRAIM